MSINFRRINDHLFWPKVEPFISAAVTRSGGEQSAGSVRYGLHTGHKQLWVGTSEEEAIEVVILTEIVRHAHKTVLVVTMCTGEDRYAWLDLVFDTLREFAEKMNCERARVLGRPGWRKDLIRLGFKHTHDILEMDLR